MPIRISLPCSMDWGIRFVVELSIERFIELSVHANKRVNGTSIIKEVDSNYHKSLKRKETRLFVRVYITYIIYITRLVCRPLTCFLIIWSKFDISKKKKKK